jgi:rhodanese-related sulfurtransferase
MLGIKVIDAPELQVLMHSEPESFLLVDVRSIREMAYGMLPGAAAMPMHLIPVRIEELRNAQKVVFYCQTGARSGRVCAFLHQQGIEQVFNLRGGIVDWCRRGYAVEAPERPSLAG